MITCPACGKENEDSAFECKRCRAPLREEAPEEQHAAAEPAPAEPSSESLGEVCRRCETYNEPGVRVCSNCGSELFGEAAAPAGSAPADADKTPPGGSPALSDELSALAISDQEAAEAAVPGGGVTSRRRVAEAAAAAAAAAPAFSRRPPPEPAMPAAEKPCASCGAINPPAAKFCFDCGTPFLRKPPAVAAPPPSVQVAPSIQVDAELAESTAEAAPVEEPLPEEQPAEAAPPEEPLPEQAPPGEASTEAAFAGEALPEEAPPVPEEAPPPFQASLVIERGPAQGTTFALGRLENSIGGGGASVELSEDPFVAPLAATLFFAEDHLVLRDEGSANGVFVKVRESAALEPGDLFVAGERLFRYEGPVELPRDGSGDTPFLGAPRPQGATVRIVEVLAGGRTGRTCHRTGPVIAIGRAGCDMNFAGDSLLAPRHAEVRLAEDGSAALVDLAAGPSGVFIRLRSQAQQDLQPGDVLQIGDQQLRVELG